MVAFLGGYGWFHLLWQHLFVSGIMNDAAELIMEHSGMFSSASSVMRR